MLCYFSPASWAVPIPQPAWRSKGSTTFTNLVYGEILLFGCCMNIFFYINKVIFQILWTIFCFFIISSLSAVWFLKISQLHENWWETPFLRKSSWGALLILISTDTSRSNFCAWLHKKTFMSSYPATKVEWCTVSRRYNICYVVLWDRVYL